MQDLALLPRPERVELAGILFLERGEQHPAEFGHHRRQLRGLVEQRPEAIVRDRRRPRRSRDRQPPASRRGQTDQRHRIDRRVEQCQGLRHAVDVEAVADLGQPVLDRIPIADERGVLGYAEIGVDRVERLAVDRVDRPGRRRQRAFQRDQELRDPAGIERLDLVERHRRRRRTGAEILGPRAQQIARIHIKQRRGGDRFPGEFGEQHVAPGDQHVQILHQGRFLIRPDPQPGDRVRIERIVVVDRDLCRVGQRRQQRFERVVPERPELPIMRGGDRHLEVAEHVGDLAHHQRVLRRIGDGREQVGQRWEPDKGRGDARVARPEIVEQSALDQRLIGRARLVEGDVRGHQRQDFDERLGHGGIENIFQPGLGVGELLVRGERAGHQHRRVEEHLPIIQAVRPVEVDLRGIEQRRRSQHRAGDRLEAVEWRLGDDRRVLAVQRQQRIDAAAAQHIAQLVGAGARADPLGGEAHFVDVGAVIRVVEPLEHRPRRRDHQRPHRCRGGGIQIAEVDRGREAQPDQALRVHHLVRDQRGERTLRLRHGDRRDPIDRHERGRLDELGQQQQQRAHFRLELGLRRAAEQERQAGGLAELAVQPPCAGDDVVADQIVEDALRASRGDIGCDERGRQHEPRERVALIAQHRQRRQVEQDPPHLADQRSLGGERRAAEQERQVGLRREAGRKLAIDRRAAGIVDDADDDVVAGKIVEDRQKRRGRDRLEEIGKDIGRGDRDGDAGRRRQLCIAGIARRDEKGFVAGREQEAPRLVLDRDGPRGRDRGGGEQRRIADQIEQDGPDHRDHRVGLCARRAAEQERQIGIGPEADRDPADAAGHADHDVVADQVVEDRLRRLRGDRVGLEIGDGYRCRRTRRADRGNIVGEIVRDIGAVGGRQHQRAEQRLQLGAEQRRRVLAIVALEDHAFVGTPDEAGVEIAIEHQRTDDGQIGVGIAGQQFVVIIGEREDLLRENQVARAHVGLRRGNRRRRAFLRPRSLAEQRAVKHHQPLVGGRRVGVDHGQRDLVPEQIVHLEQIGPVGPRPHRTLLVRRTRHVIDELIRDHDLRLDPLAVRIGKGAFDRGLVGNALRGRHGRVGGRVLGALELDPEQIEPLEHIDRGDQRRGNRHVDRLPGRPDIAVVADHREAVGVGRRPREIEAGIDRSTDRVVDRAMIRVDIVERGQRDQPVEIGAVGGLHRRDGHRVL